MYYCEQVVTLSQGLLAKARLDGHQASQSVKRIHDLEAQLAQAAKIEDIQWEKEELAGIASNSRGSWRRRTSA